MRQAAELVEARAPAPSVLRALSARALAVNEDLYPHQASAPEFLFEWCAT